MRHGRVHRGLSVSHLVLVKNSAFWVEVLDHLEWGRSLTEKIGAALYNRSSPLHSRLERHKKLPQHNVTVTASHRTMVERWLKQPALLLGILTSE